MGQTDKLQYNNRFHLSVNFIKKNTFNILAVFLFLTVGLVYLFPHFVRYNELRAQDKMYFPWTVQADMDMANVHAGRYRDVIDGHFLAGEIDTYEHRDAPIMWPILSAAIFTPILIISKSIPFTVITTDFAFSIFLAVSFFLVIYCLTKNRYFSLVASFIAMLFPQLSVLIPPSSINDVETVVRQMIPVLWNDKIVSNLTYFRRDAFIPAGLFFIIFFYLTHRAIQSDEIKLKRIFNVMAGIGYGLIFYFYIYYWIYASIFLGIFFLLLMVNRNFDQAKRTLLITLIGLVVSIPFWINYYYLVSLPQYPEIIARAGMEVGRAFRLDLWKTYILYIFFIGIVYWLGVKFKKNISRIFLISLCVSQIVALNIQIVTGFNIQSDHWSTRVSIIINVFVLSYICYYLFIYFNNRFPIDKFKNWLIGLVVVLMASLLCNIIYSESILERKNYFLYSVPNNLMSAYEWLNNNTGVDSVVMTPSLATNIDLPIYTHNRIFLSRAPTTIASEKEILERFNITYKFFGANTEFCEKILSGQEAVRYFFSQSYDNKSLDTFLRPSLYTYYVLPDQAKQEMVNNYEKYRLGEKLPYRLDYIFIGPREKDSGLNLAVLDNYELVYNNKDVKIYKNH